MEGLSPRTVRSYEAVLKKWIGFVGNVEVTKIQPQKIAAYLNWLQTEYKPNRHRVF